MKINTRDFGEMEMEDSAIITFTRPIYGFENLTKFVILTDDEFGNSIIWLQSIEVTKVCFILINVVDFGFHYDDKLPEETKKLLKTEHDEDIVFLTMANMKDTLADSTVNLKSPVLINTETKLACQEILDADYPIKFPLFQEVK